MTRLTQDVTLLKAELASQKEVAAAVSEQKTRLQVPMSNILWVYTRKPT